MSRSSEVRCVSWNKPPYSTALHDPSLRALRIHTLDMQMEWNMNLVALKVTHRKVITHLKITRACI